MSDFVQVLKDKFGDQISTSSNFSELTTLEIGGPITAFFETKSTDELKEIISFAKENSIPFLAIGGGSNLLVSDQGYEGLIIKNSVIGIEEIDEKLVVKSGTILQTLVDYTITAGYSGFQKMSGIPGTVGGAVYGDAGAYGNSIRDFLIEVVAWDGEKEVKFTKEECRFGYRESIFKQNKFTILEISFFGFSKAVTEDLEKEAEEIIQKRTQKYPPNTKCPGSFFKNVEAQNLPTETLEKVKQYNTKFNKIPAGALVEAVGGKGDSLGKISIATNHANTFFNTGGGTAEDFYNLAKKYYLKVKDQFGIELKPEVQLINLPKFDE